MILHVRSHQSPQQRTRMVDSRPPVTSAVVMEALRKGESAGRSRAMSARQIAVAILGCDPSAGGKGMGGFTPHISLSALRRVLASMVEDGSVTLLDDPGARPTMPPQWVALHAAATDEARLRRGNKHTPIKIEMPPLSPSLEKECREAVESWQEQKAAVAGVLFGSRRGYVITTTLNALRENAQVRTQVESARAVADRARREALALHQDRVKHAVREALAEAGLPSPERFMQAGASL